MMNIKPSAAIRKNYNQISDLCRKTGEPVYLTKNGEGDLVVMDVESFARRESLLKLKEKLLQSELDIQKGQTYTVDETVAAMRALWRDDEAAYHGEYVDFDPVWLYPKPKQAGGPASCGSSGVIASCMAVA